MWSGILSDHARTLRTKAAAPEHIAHCYKRHANAYVVKPDDFDDYQRTVRSIDEFYARVCTGPARELTHRVRARTAAEVRHRYAVRVAGSVRG